MFIQHISVAQMEQREFINESKMAEQFIQQHLLRIGRKNEKTEIFYWLREGRKENAEIDFVTQLEGQIVPVEVKAGTTGSLKSLHQFMNEKKLRKAVRFDLKLPSMMDAVHKLTHDPRNPGVSFRLLSLPLYMIEQLPRLFPLTSPGPMKEK